MADKKVFYSSQILLPGFLNDAAAMKKYSVIACDQFTSEPQYWECAAQIAGSSTSALNLIVPEVYLDKADEMIPSVHEKMCEYREKDLTFGYNGMIYVERTLPSNGRVRRGIVGMIDLCDFEYTKGSKALIRSSEATVTERIPARVKVRRGALLELPHVMLFYDDPSNGLTDLVEKMRPGLDKLYDFDLMQGSCNIKGFGINAEKAVLINEYLCENCEKDGLVFTVGDGNHSLAAAKSYFEEIKAKYGDKAYDMPCRYALVEIVNIHDEAIEFEPIYRLIRNTTAKRFIAELSEKLDVRDHPTENCYRYDIVSDGKTSTVYVNDPGTALPVAELQSFLDGGQYSIDYIHGLDSIKALSVNGNVGVIFEGMKKSDLFPAVVKDGALARKTFSMGEAKDKRFYLEARVIN